MQWFYDLKIRTKLLSGFITVAIIAGIIGAVGYFNIQTLNNSDTELYENMTVPITLMTNFSTDFQRIRVNMRDMIITDDSTEIEDKINKIAELRSNVDKNMEEFSNSISSDDMQKTYDKLTEARKEFAKQYTIVEDLVRANKDEQALVLIAETGNMGIASRSEQDLIAELISMKLEEAHQKAETNTVKANTAGVIMIIVLIAGIVIAIAFGLFLSKIISTPINRLAAAADLLAVGDVNVNIKSSSKDEVGFLMDSFEKMALNIEYQAKTAEMIANGDFSMEVIPKSDKDILSKSIKTMVTTLKNLVNEASMLTQAAVEGKLSTRGNTMNFSGGYRDIVSGVNSTLDSVIAPVQEAAAVLKEMSEGNLQVRVVGNYMGDHAEIKNALNDTLEALSSYIKEISYVLSEMADSNLDLSINNEYKGDFSQIKEALTLIVSSLNDVLSDVNSATDQVALGSRQVSDSSISLSQGATEQASSIEELTASIEQIASQTKTNAHNADHARTIAETARNDAAQGNEQMQHMLKAIAEINESSNNISKIIKVIDEIAFQTNILALNAAVEAARAGKHGKGFAVVAEEVRTLAARSASAAKETTDMIEGSIVNVEEGTKIANTTAQALNNIVLGVAEVASLVDNIATASNEQANGVEQINLGIMQISEVVQSTSATSEETAAASEELSGQADLLKSQVSKFRLKRQDRSGGYRGYDNFSPEMTKMLSEMNDTAKKVKSPKNPSPKAITTKKNAMNDKEFGKY